MPEKNSRPWWKRWWGILAILFLVVVGIILGYFLFYFFTYYSLAKQGKLSAADATIFDKFTISNRLAKQVKTNVGQVNVVTTDDPYLGNPAAKLVVVEFADFQCLFSKEESYVVRELASKYPDLIYFIYRDFPLDDIHPEARLAAEAGHCAEELGNFWALHDKIYQNQDRLSREDLIRYARESGLDETIFSQCLDSGKYKNKVEQDYQAGLEAGVRGTPTFFINGSMVEGAIPKDIFEQLIGSIIS